MKTDLGRSFERLEKQVWPEPDHSSHLVTTIHKLRKKPLKDFSTEYLRIVAQQNLSLEYPVPLAIAKFKQNILDEGDHHAGDWPHAVLTSEKQFWIYDTQHWKNLKELFEKSPHRFVPANEFGKMEESFSKFETINT